MAGPPIAALDGSDQRAGTRIRGVPRADDILLNLASFSTPPELGARRLVLW